MHDIRLCQSFFTHPKIRRLDRVLGDRGVLSLIKLWCYAGTHFTKGELNYMDESDIEEAASWRGEKGVFIRELVELKLLDVSTNGTYSIHDWKENQRYVYFHKERSEMAKRANAVRWEKDKEKQGRNTNRNTNGNAEWIAPLPLPPPVPIPKDLNTSVSSPEPTNGSGTKPTPWSTRISWNPDRGCFEGITPEILSNWGKAYPAVDLNSQLNRADEWLKANPTKLKKNYYRFVVNWLSRAQERGGR